MMTRVYLLFETTDLKFTEHPDWKIEKHERKSTVIDREGLVIIEWGGSQLNNSSQLLNFE